MKTVEEIIEEIGKLDSTHISPELAIARWLIREIAWEPENAEQLVERTLLAHTRLYQRQWGLA